VAIAILNVLRLIKNSPSRIYACREDTCSALYPISSPKPRSAFHAKPSPEDGGRIFNEPISSGCCSTAGAAHLLMVAPSSCLFHPFCVFVPWRELFFIKPRLIKNSPSRIYAYRMGA
jgi:hypothetical protein